MDETKEKRTVIRVLLPQHLRKKLKAKCAEEGKNMTEKIIEFITRYVYG